MTGTSDYLTINQVCAWLQVSRRTLYNWMNAGKIAFVRLPSGTRRIVRASVLAVQAAPPEESVRG